MRIGVLAVHAGVNIQTLRFYEREGLLRAPGRTVSGYRSYEVRDLDRVRFIRVCQGLGFTLREVQQLLHLHQNLRAVDGDMNRGEAHSAKTMEPAAVEEIARMAEERMAVIDEKIQALVAMRAELVTLMRGLAEESKTACPAAR